MLGRRLLIQTVQDLQKVEILEQVIAGRYSNTIWHQLKVTL